MPSEISNEQDPASTLTQALLQAYQLPTTPQSNAFKAVKKAFSAFLQGSTCEKISHDELVDIPEALIDVDDLKLTRKPLVVRYGKVYLTRLDHLEQRLADQIKARLLPLDTKAKPKAHWLPKPKPSFTGVDQQNSVKLAVQASLFVLTGGPGTGKTTTAACIIGANLEYHRLRLEDVRLCAPTGRAASQLHGGLIDASKALAIHCEKLGCKDVVELKHRLPKSYTIHKFVHNPEMMEGAKLVIVDECSMIDLGLFHELLSIIPSDARIVLIGDPQQLPSVDTGSVFADICRNQLIRDRLCTLTEPLRADGQARTWYNFAVGYQERKKTPHPEQGLREAKITAVLESSLEKYQSVAKLANSSVYSKPEEPPTAAQLVDLENNIKSVRILCAYHGGELGVRKLNERIRKELGLKKPDSPGSLVMITRNDARVTNLSNGDVGLVVKDGLVWFPGKTVAIPFNQLPPNTPAFATTIHKSQGSEYSSVLLVLPKPDSNDEEDNREAFINKQLVFTGITRAKDNLTVFSTSDTLYDALDEPADRASGLDKRLC
jgi:exodeoxyribonuclease V alpha subunit